MRVSTFEHCTPKQVTSVVLMRTILGLAAAAGEGGDPAAVKYYTPIQEDRQLLDDLRRRVPRLKRPPNPPDCPQMIIPWLTSTRPPIGGCHNLYLPAPHTLRPRP